MKGAVGGGLVACLLALACTGGTEGTSSAPSASRALRVPVGAYRYVAHERGESYPVLVRVEKPGPGEWNMIWEAAKKPRPYRIEMSWTEERLSYRRRTFDDGRAVYDLSGEVGEREIRVRRLLPDEEACVGRSAPGTVPFELLPFAAAGVSGPRAALHRCYVSTCGLERVFVIPDGEETIAGLPCRRVRIRSGRLSPPERAWFHDEEAGSILVRYDSSRLDLAPVLP
jgi:hypothetical protein